MDSATKQTALRRLIAHNVTLALKYREQSQSGAARKAVEVHQTTIGRLAAGERDNRLSTLYAAAQALEYEPWQFLVPGFDPADPPKLLPADVRKALKAL